MIDLSRKFHETVFDEEGHVSHDGMNKLGSEFDAFDIAWTEELIYTVFMTQYVGTSNIVILHEEKVIIQGQPFFMLVRGSIVVYLP